VSETLPFQAAQRAAQVLMLPLNDVGSEGAIGTIAIALEAQALGQVEHDRDRNTVVLPR
jgi:hypothetical protein